MVRYLRDTGLLHELLGIRSEKSLFTHPKCGASWEGYAIEETLKLVQPDNAYFWATHQGAELDLLLFKDGRRLFLVFQSICLRNRGAASSGHRSWAMDGGS